MENVAQRFLGRGLCVAALLVWAGPLRGAEFKAVSPRTVDTPAGEKDPDATPPAGLAPAEKPAPTELPKWWAGGDYAGRGHDTLDLRLGPSRQALHPSTNLYIEGLILYAYSGGLASYYAERISNYRSGGISGTLKLELWATTFKPVFGGTINNVYTLASYTLGQLSGGFHFSNVNTGNVPFSRPPDGTYYITMALMEFSGGQYVYVDLRTMTVPVTQCFGLACAAVPPCVTGPNNLCLLSSRFRVEVSFSDYGGNYGIGTAVPLTSDTGYFWFFNSANVEVFAKVLNFCAVSGTYALYANGLTDLQTRIRLTDTNTGLYKDYTNALGNGFKLIADGAFSCP